MLHLIPKVATLKSKISTFMLILSMLALRYLPTLFSAKVFILNNINHVEKSQEVSCIKGDLDIKIGQRIASNKT